MTQGSIQGKLVMNGNPIRMIGSLVESLESPLWRAKRGLQRLVLGGIGLGTIVLAVVEHPAERSGIGFLSQVLHQLRFREK